MKNYKIFIPIIYLLICLFWGSSWLVIKLSLEYLNPLFNLGLRFLIAAFSILLVIKWTNTKLDFSKESIKIYFLMGIFSYSLPFYLVYWAEQTIPSSLASVLFGMYPFFIAILSSIFIKEESLTINRILGIFLSFFGIVLIFSDGLKFDIRSYSYGQLAVIASALMQAGIAITIKKKGGYLNPLSMNFLPLLIASFVLFIFSFQTEDISKNKLTIEPILMILYLAIFVTVFNFTAYYWLMKKINIVLLSLTSFITPVIAVALGILIGKEHLTRNILAGTIMVLLGIIIVNLNGIKKFYHQRRFSSL